MSVKLLCTAGIFALMAGPALAQDASPAFAMNTMFLVVCTILVMWMTAGFTMLEVGFVRAKNVVNQCAKNFGLFATASICFLLVGYGFLFPNGDWIIPGIIGSYSAIEVGSVAQSDADFGAKENADAINILFHMMFCAAVASIVSGALAERMKLMSFFIFTAALTAVIYPIQASWTWGGGFLATQFGFQDLAGGTVIHVAGGVAALTGSIIIGARRGRFENGKTKIMTSFNLPLATLGALILWMGWFGFNAGSYLGFTTDADASNVARIMLNTNMAAAGGVMGAAFVSFMRYNRFDLTFMINGALGGLVSITAEPLFPSPILAVLIGVTGGLIVVWAVMLLEKLKIDDVVGAVPVHLFCGAWGTIAVVLSNPSATLIGQAASMGIVAAYMAVTTTVVWLALKATIGVRVSSETEEIGVDESEMVLEN